ncbi:hypothetical protein C1H46_020210 [Malus baccata]|uniref:Peptidase A1 domain-containing protein n=1 Tax=Malus baccata TaxID=106549 RepID=A0A540M6L2_MALBA|nr:hypothetical protein C1H46_020210 [Malus baccata]
MAATARTIVALLGGFLVFFASAVNVSGNMVFPVNHKFKGPGKQVSLGAWKEHDARRHRRLLAGADSAVDLQLGGNGHPSEAGLYIAKIGLGSPSKDFHVQVDTGSDVLWVNCAECSNCPTKNNLGFKLTMYDAKSSSTSSKVTCDQEFCTSSFNGKLPDCKADMLCNYSISYGDGSTTSGYYVKDNIQLDKVNGNHQTTSTYGTVVFGCGAKQSGNLGKSPGAVDGILGFGQANASVISQLSSSGKVKKQFAHCLDNVKGGGIWAIGEVVEPKVKNTTPLIPNLPHYTVTVKSVEVGGDVVDFPTDLFGLFEDRNGVVIDSGTTLAYLSPEFYEPFMKKIYARQSGLKKHTVDEQFTCFEYSRNVDDGFPVVKFNFKNSAVLTAYPHDYLFQLKASDDVWCSGWQTNSMKSKDGKSMTILGDLVLSNKLVLYDIENQAIGWTDYNCTSSIKLKDEKSGQVYSVGAHNLSSASGPMIGRIQCMPLIRTYDWDEQQSAYYPGIGFYSI